MSTLMTMLDTLPAAIHAAGSLIPGTSSGGGWLASSLGALPLLAMAAHAATPDSGDHHGDDHHGDDHHDDHGHHHEDPLTMGGILGSGLVVFVGLLIALSVGLKGPSPSAATDVNPLLFWIVLCPALGALFNGLFGRKLPRAVVNTVACTSIGVSFFFSVLAVKALAALPAGSRTLAHNAYEWVAIDSFRVAVEFVLDPLSAVMILVITGVGFLIHLYSTGYMSHDQGFARFFTYLNLFCFAMLLLVLGGNMIITFVGWEGVGMCSYLLIGFWFTDDAKAAAGKKAFIVNRVGDFAFLIGLFMIFFAADTVDYQALKSIAADPTRVGLLLPIATASTIFLFIGCTGKSAQIPLYVWLPDAMAGPTPVSALIHAATMVTAGVYLICRLNFLFALAPITLAIIMTIGALTALMGATIGCTQTGIKKVLAYSTVSQLGFMFMAVGTGAFAAGLFHVMTHAFFKALLFLGAGSVMHGMSDEEDIMKMGDLRNHMPYTHATFLIGCIAIAGVPLFSGFFSKDMLLFYVFTNDYAASPMPGLHVAVYAIGLFTAALTAFYMFRLYFLTFWGKLRAPDHIREHIHESPWTMTVPLMGLAFLAVFGGYLWIPEVLPLHDTFNVLPTWLNEIFEPSKAAIKPRFDIDFLHTWEWIGMGLSTAIAFAGIGTAFYIYGREGQGTGKIVNDLMKDNKPLQTVHKVLWNKYYIDEIYDAIIVRPFFFAGKIMHKVIDEFLIDLLLVNGTSWLAESLGHVGKRLQNGNVQRYAAYIALGLGAIMILMFRGRIFG